jgi:ABC-2 type transport system permease protein
MSWWDICKKEMAAIFRNPAILLTIFGGVVFYSFLYPLPYAQQVPRELKVVVVNLDNSQLSRSLERMVDASPQVQLSGRAHSLAEAQEMFVEDSLAGIMLIPENFYRDLLLNKRPTLSFAGDASYFLVYGTVLEGMAGAGATLAAQVKVAKMVMSGQSMVMASEQYSAIKLNIFSAFNETLGYVNYVIPAIFILILHQTLLMGAGILGGGQNEELLAGKGDDYWLRAPGWKLLPIRLALFVIIYWILCMYYFGFTFSFYGIPHLADFSQLNLFVLPFLLASTFLGIALGFILPRRELATLLVLLSSMPLIFASGFVWPVSSVPEGLVQALQFIPVIPAMNGFLRLNQMGADFMDVFVHWRQLWICTGLYGCLCCFLLWNKRRNAAKSIV